MQKKLNEADVVALLRNKYGNKNVHRLTGLRIRGVPDVLIALKQRAFFLEIKISPEELTAVQKVFIALFSKSSGVLYVNNDTDVVEFHGPKALEEVIEAITGKKVPNEQGNKNIIAN